MPPTVRKNVLKKLAYLADEQVTLDVLHSLVLEAYIARHGSRTEAARILGVSPRTLYNWSHKPTAGPRQDAPR